MVLPTEFESVSLAREASMIGRYTTGALVTRVGPPNEEVGYKFLDFLFLHSKYGSIRLTGQ